MTAVSGQAGQVLSGSARAFLPSRMLEVELAAPLPAVAAGSEPTRAWVLIRFHTEPIATCILDIPPGGLDPEHLAAELWPHAHVAIALRFTGARMAVPKRLTSRGLTADPAEWPFLAARSAVLATPPFISIVICTRNRPDRLAACLRYVRAQQYQRFEVIVVDNAPGGEAVPALVRGWQGTARCRYVAEPLRGLSRARNAGAAASSGEIIAFLDDDEEADGFWLAELARGFSRGADVGCVSGMIVPTRIDTPAQEWFERRGGHSQGRGCQPAVFSPNGPQSPLYPLPPFGAGGNMAFRREALTRIGGFDTALGAGTPACAGEDTLALTQVLLAGYSIAYEPGALVRHDHYPDFQGLARQVHNYGIGLTAYYAALLRHRPALLIQLLRLMPTAAGYLRQPPAIEQQEDDENTRSIQRLHRKGMIMGPAAYARSLRVQARVAQSQATTGQAYA